MKIGKKTISFGILQLSNFYIDFDRFVEKKGLEYLAETWSKLFEGMKFDYDEAEKDFKQSIFDLIRFQRNTPTFSDILDGMRELHHQAELKEKKIRYDENL